MSHDPGAYALGRAIGGAFQDAFDIYEARRVQGIINQVVHERDQANAWLRQVVSQRDQALAERDQAQAERDQAQARIGQLEEKVEKYKRWIFEHNNYYSTTLHGPLYRTVEDLVAHRAQRAVFRYALAQVAPNHPLVTDAALREGISKAGSYEWMNRSIGEPGTFIVEGEPDRLKPGEIWQKVDDGALAYYKDHLRRMEQERRRREGAG